MPLSKVVSNSLSLTTLAASGAATLSSSLGVAGVTTFAAGTAALPSITTSGDTNTGIFFPAADTIAFSEGGAEAMRIDSSGNVGIGTNAPATKIEIKGSGVSFTVNNTDTAAYATSKILFNNTSVGSSIATIIAQRSISTSGGFLIFNTNTDAGVDTERVRIDSNGTVGIGTTNNVANARSTIALPQGAGNEAPLGLVHGPYSHRVGPVSNGAFVVYRASDNVGQYQTYGATSWTATSDERLKTNLKPIENGISKVNSLRSVIGRFKTDDESVSRSFLIAQDVQAVLPEAVSVGLDGMLGVQYTEVIPLLVAAIKEQQALITAQSATITALTDRVDTQAADIAELKTKIA